MTTSQRQAIITLVQKPGKDHTFIKSWRPISLLNVDLKILSKILAKRIQNALCKIIGPEQNAFIKNRHIGDTVRLISDVLYETDKNNIPGILFGADFAAAFDSVDIIFMIEVLKKFGFCDNFIKWVKILHTNIESCVVNSGNSTGYFRLHRGTRQGDPLAPYLFILVIEILKCLVKENNGIKGIKIHDKEIKVCLFADDSTFFLKDIASLNELKKILLSFSTYSSIEVNYDKSEIAWIGEYKDKEPESGVFHWLNLCKESIKILGIHFTYNKQLSEQFNFERILTNLQTVTNMWRCRPLTLFGKTTIIKTLALPKILYVTSMIEAPPGFTDRVKAIVTKFLWSGRTAKVKYTALVNGKSEGGIDFPDIESQLKSQRIMCLKRLFEKDLKEQYTPIWKHIPLFHLRNFGGAQFIKNNLNVKMISKSIPPFYKTCLIDWASLFKLEPTTSKSVMAQPLVGNIYLPFKQNMHFVNFLIQQNILYLGDIIKRNGTLKNLSEITPITSELYKQHFLSWSSLISSIPKKWLSIMSRENCFDCDMSGKILLSTDIIYISKLKSKLVYNCTVAQISQEPSIKKKIEARHGTNIWNNICKNIYSSIDTYTQYFQYKIVHNYLAVNQKLYKWKLIDSPRCSYCSTDVETIEHLFCDCHLTRSFYFKVQQWCASFDLVLPELNVLNVLYGLIPTGRDTLLINTLLMLYKKIVFSCKSKNSKLLLVTFKVMVKELEIVEKNISKLLNKSMKHKNKWKKYLSQNLKDL